jgi:hypothetical protein
MMVIILDTTLYDKVCKWLWAGRWFYLVTPPSSTNKTEILLKVALITIIQLSVVSNTELAFYLKASKTIRHILMHYND